MWRYRRWLSSRFLPVYSGTPVDQYVGISICRYISASVYGYVDLQDVGMSRPLVASRAKACPPISFPGSLVKPELLRVDTVRAWTLSAFGGSSLSLRCCGGGFTS